MRLEFHTRLDTTSKIVTALMAPIFLFFPAVFYFIFKNVQEKGFMPLFIFLAIFLILVFMYCFLTWPKKYIIDNNSLVVHSTLKQNIYNRNEISKIESVTKSEMGLAWRLFGNGGIFGYTGIFANKKFGKMRWFVTDTNEVVVITLNNSKKIVLSPIENSAFVKAIQNPKI